MIRKNKKAAKNRLLFFGSISFLCIFYFLSTLFTNLISVKQLQEEQIDLENSLINLKENEELLKIEIVKLKDPDYLARYAREHYMYSVDGEYVLKIEQKKEETPKITKKEKNNHSFLFPTLIAIFSIIGIIFIKKVIF